MKLLILCVVCFFIFVGSTSAEYKRWLRDTNFGNPVNWNLKRAPCGNDVTIIPDESPVVYVQFNTTIKELILPKNGELLLGRNIVLGFRETPVEGCDDVGGDLEFAAIHPEAWFDPENWCGALTELGACTSKFSLDTDKIPCIFDDIVFPRERSYFVDISDDTPPFSVKSLKIAATTFTTTTFTSYLNTTEGARMFRLPRSGATGVRLNITRRSCDLTSGCGCGNDRPEIAKVICSHVEKRCTRPRCSQTIQPLGACCRMCGAVFNITRGYGFNINSFTTSLKSKFFSDPAQSGVNMTSTLTSEGWVQVVVTDVTGKGSISIAREMLQDFNNDVAQGGHEYAIDRVTVSFVTDTSNPSHSANTGGAEMTGGSIAGLVLGIIVVIILIVVVVVFFVFRKSGKRISMPTFHLPSAPNLRGFPRRIPRATARVLPGAFHQPHTASHIDPGFANPLYDSSPFDDGNFVMKEMEMIAATSEEQPTFEVSEGGFQNPLFGSSGASKYSDPTSTGQASATTTAATASSRKQVDVPTSIHIDNPNSVNGDSTI